MPVLYTIYNFSYRDKEWKFKLVKPRVSGTIADAGRRDTTMLGKKKAKPVKHDIQRLCDFAHQSEESNSDVLGSYTGTPKDGGRPVQDADDL